MQLTVEDQALIEEVIKQGGDVWENKALLALKRRIKSFYLAATSDQCCYCRRDLNDEFNMVIDIEHIIPKALFPKFMFEVTNLNVSCKRCNMRIKRNRVDFLLDLSVIEERFGDSAQYRFVHPNLDRYADSILLIVMKVGDKKYIKYKSITEKGTYTYNYFELDKIETNTLNVAQGLPSMDAELPGELSLDLRRELAVLIDRLEQAH